MFRLFSVLANQTLGFCIEKKKYILLVLFVLILIAAFHLRQIGHLESKKVIMVVQQQPVFAPLLFIMFYALMIILLLPTLPLNLAAGFLWGTIWGSFFTLIASAVGAAGCFLLGRSATFDFLKNQSNSQLWQLIKKAINKNDWKIVAFTRLNPIFPFGLISYFYGATTITFKRYIWFTIVFLSPLVFAFSYIGALLGDITPDKNTQHLITNILIISFVVTVLTGLGFIINSYLKRSPSRFSKGVKNPSS